MQMVVKDGRLDKEGMNYILNQTESFMKTISKPTYEYTIMQMMFCLMKGMIADKEQKDKENEMLLGRINMLEKSLNDTIVAMNSVINTVNNQNELISSLQANQGNNNSAMNNEPIDNKIEEKVDEKINQIDERINELEGKIESTKSNNTNTTGDDDLEERVNVLEDKVNILVKSNNNSITYINEVIKTVNEANSKVKKCDATIKSMKKQIDSLNTEGNRSHGDNDIEEMSQNLDERITALEELVEKNNTNTQNRIERISDNLSYRMDNITCALNKCLMY